MTDNNYIELYKEYRPRVWDDLIGQEKVAKSLQSAVKNNKIPTAYLFSGTRGVGKTSAALLLAKSINCENPDKDANPCNECDICISIDNNNQFGVHYISMANQGTTDDIRELVRKAELNQPIKKQVFILDEIHTIHKQAFDSLLIPLEKKNNPALFILCTTEIDRIPQTILSRVQQRKFNAVDADTMREHLNDIRTRSGLDFSDDEIEAAIRMGRGSVRDTLTSLDNILETGSEQTSFGAQLLVALAKKDIALTLGVMAEASQNSVNFRDFAEQLFEDLRDLLLISNNVDRSLVSIIPVDNEEAIIKGLCGKTGIIRLMGEVGDAITQMSTGMDSRIRMELALIKGIQSLNAIIKAYKAKQQ